MAPFPGYWMHETTGELRPAVRAYRAGQMSPAQVAVMRAYLRQWITAECWIGPDAERLRAEVDGLTGRVEIARWMDLAAETGINPL